MTGAADRVAVIGLGLRVPGATTFDALWANLRDGVASISFFDPATHPPTEPVPDGGCFVAAGGVLPDAELFDPALFGMTVRQAQLLDPQKRKFLECAWEALEGAGYLGAGAAVGVYGALRSRSYYHANAERVAYHERDALYGLDVAAVTARHLDLRGPAISLDGTCSAGLHAIHLACQAVLAGECELALAGAAGISPEIEQGYVHVPGSELSPDGRCRPFDAAAQGVAPGDGVGVLALKRLDDALRDRDHVHGVIAGSAVNHAGAARPVFAAHVALIEDALAAAGVRAADIAYVEAHGAGSLEGDAAEVAALADAFRAHGVARGACALGSLKPNLGHSGAPTGVAMVMKVLGALRHGELPPTLGYANANPRIAFERTAFRVTTARRPWPERAGPRRAATGVFGEEIANAFVILEEAPPRPAAAPTPGWLLAPLSARTPAALDHARRRLHAHLVDHPDAELADVAYTLQVGRRPLAARWVAVVRDRGELLAALVDPAARPAVAEPGRAAVDAVAQAWLAGAPVDFTALHGAAPRRRVPLPTYPFEHAWVSLRPARGAP